MRLRARQGAGNSRLDWEIEGGGSGALGWPLQLQIGDHRPHFVHKVGAGIGFGVAILWIKFQKERRPFHPPVFHVSDKMRDRILGSQKADQRVPPKTALAQLVPRPC